MEEDEGSKDLRRRVRKVKKKKKKKAKRVVMIGARRTDIADQILSSTKKEDGAALQLTPVKERKSGD